MQKLVVLTLKLYLGLRWDTHHCKATILFSSLGVIKETITLSFSKSIQGCSKPIQVGFLFKKDILEVTSKTLSVKVLNYRMVK